MCRSNNGSDVYDMYHISLFDIQAEPINTIGPTMRFFVHCWNHHRIFLSLSTQYRFLVFLTLLRQGPHDSSCGQALLKLVDVIWWSLGKLSCRKGWNSALESVIEVTFYILNPDVMRFRQDPLVGIGILYLAIKSQMLNRWRAVKWVIVEQQPILKFNKYVVHQYILIISEHQSTNFVSLVLFNLSTE